MLKYKDYSTLVNEQQKEYESFFLKSAFRYELANHEFCITYELDDTLDALLLTYEQVNSDPVMKKALLEAKKEYLKNCEDWM